MGIITKPIALDETLQATNAKLQNIADALNADALTAGRALVSNAQGRVSTALTSATEIGYVNGVTSPIQTQINDVSTRISNLESLGRFLAIWNCTTGLPTSNPATLPYEYKTGDYYRVGTVNATTNYMPDGDSYTGTASTTVYSGEKELSVGSVFYFDGSSWKLQPAGSSGQVEDVQINGTSILNGGVANIPVASSGAYGVIKTWEGTQSQYDAIAVRDNDTYYFITD